MFVAGSRVFHLPQQQQVRLRAGRCGPEFLYCYVSKIIDPNDIMLYKMFAKHCIRCCLPCMYQQPKTISCETELFLSVLASKAYVHCITFTGNSSSSIQ